MKDRIRILVGVDGSNHSDRALLEAATIAKKFSGSVKVITVYGRGMEKKAKEILEHAELYLENEVEYTTSSILGSSIVLGSVSRRVVANANCNVLVVKK